MIEPNIRLKKKSRKCAGLIALATAVLALPIAAEVEGPSLQVTPGGEAFSPLENLFALPSVWVLNTNFGEIPLQLTPDVAPVTVENFEWYANEGRYENSFFHRSVPGFVLQGGGFFFQAGEESTSIESVPTRDPIVNEPNVSNTRGTIAMAKVSGDPDSATSQWFINFADNGETLDDQNGGFTVFGEVIGEGMAVVDAIEEVPTYDATEQIRGPFGELPLSEPELNVEFFVRLLSVTRGEPEVSVAFLQGDSADLEIAIDGGNLVVAANAGASGSYELLLSLAYYDLPPVEYPLTVEIVEEAKWFDAADTLEDGWRFFDWFKGFRPGPGNWIFHGRLGWMFVVGESTDGLYLWDSAMGRWLWTNETVYPWMYASGPDEGWYFFFEAGRPGSRFFSSGKSGQIISEQDLRVP